MDDGVLPLFEFGFQFLDFNGQGFSFRRLGRFRRLRRFVLGVEVELSKDSIELISVIPALIVGVF